MYPCGHPAKHKGINALIEVVNSLTAQGLLVAAIT